VASLIGLYLLFRHLNVSKTRLEASQTVIDAKSILDKLQLKVNEARKILREKPRNETEEDEEEESFNLSGAITPEAISQWLTMDSGTIVDYFYKNKTIPAVIPRTAAIGFVDKLKEQLKGGNSMQGGLPDVKERFM
jgi:hypothetical protein